MAADLVPILFFVSSHHEPRVETSIDVFIVCASCLGPLRGKSANHAVEAYEQLLAGAWASSLPLFAFAFYCPKMELSARKGPQRMNPNRA